MSILIAFQVTLSGCKSKDVSYVCETTYIINGVPIVTKTIVKTKAECTG